jgi:hypothetical protein
LHYESERHRSADNAKRKKNELYFLKARGIAAAYQNGRILPIQINGGLCLYQGEGYRFHSTLLPAGADVARNADDATVTIEAKPQGSKEPLQRDAIAVLERLPDIDMSKFTRLEVPRVESKSKVRCHRCGEVGHKKADCNRDADEYADDEGENFN